MLFVAIRTPRVRLQPPRSRCRILANASHRHPNRQDRSTGSRLEATRFPAQSTFRRERSQTPHVSVRRSCVTLLEVFPRGCHARSLSPDLCSETPSRPRHFLGARHSLGSCSREHAPEGRQEPSDRLLPPNSSLPICTRALDARRSFWARARLLRGARQFTLARPASAGPFDGGQGVRLPAS